MSSDVTWEYITVPGQRPKFKAYSDNDIALGYIEYDKDCEEYLWQQYKRVRLNKDVLREVCDELRRRNNNISSEEQYT